MRFVSFRPALAVLATTLLFPLASSAGVLITQDGDQIKTKGQWATQGDRVVYVNENGNLSAIRLAEIDLEKSQSSEPTHTPQAAKDLTEEPALVIDNESLAKRDASPAEPAKRTKRGSGLATSTREYPEGELDKNCISLVDMDDDKVRAEVLRIAQGLKAELDAVAKRHDLKSHLGWQDAADDFETIATELSDLSAHEFDQTRKTALAQFSDNLMEVARVARYDSTNAAAKHRAGTPVITLEI